MSSGSAPSPAAVNPTRSAKITETVLRSSPPVSGADVSGVSLLGEPQEGQNLASPGSVVPQELQRRSSGEPQLAQKRASDATEVPQEGQEDMEAECMGERCGSPVAGRRLPVAGGRIPVADTVR